MELDSREEALQLTARHLASASDITLLLLKGHLLAEVFLTDLLARLSKRSAPLREARLSFHQLVRVAHAFYPESAYTWLWASLGDLNTLRNTLAHKLEPEDFDIKVLSFLQSLQPHIETSSKNIVERLREALVVMCGVLYNLDREIS